MKYNELPTDKKFKNKIICELQKNNVNIKNKDFYKKDSYKKFRTKYLNLDLYGEITYDYYVEKVLLSQEEINDIKQGMFDIGTKRDYKDKDLTKDKLYKEIDIEEGKDQDVYLYDIIKSKIAGSSHKGGIIKKLKEVLNLDVNSFNDKYSE
ncbi:hypothetical protein, partial [Terrisporobacter petrolearius]|uniref:hypothetical protein n=1 Tax=Terrisporobacter petrolearius TaxID=1460447 RepID=UPI0022E6858A